MIQDVFCSWQSECCIDAVLRGSPEDLFCEALDRQPVGGKRGGSRRGGRCPRCLRRCLHNIEWNAQSMRLLWCCCCCCCVRSMICATKQVAIFTTTMECVCSVKYQRVKSVHFEHWLFLSILIYHEICRVTRTCDGTLCRLGPYD